MLVRYEDRPEGRRVRDETEGKVLAVMASAARQEREGVADVDREAHGAEPVAAARRGDRERENPSDASLCAFEGALRLQI